MTILVKQPNDPLGREVSGNTPMRIPHGTETNNSNFNAQTGFDGIVMNRTKKGIDIYVNGERLTILPTSAKIEIEQTLSNAQTVPTNVNSIYPLRFSSSNAVATIELPETPAKGDTVGFYDSDGSFGKTSGINIYDNFDSITSWREFRTKGGWWVLQYKSSTEGWKVVSNDKPGELIIAIPGVLNTAPGKSTAINRPGTFICMCDTLDQTYKTPLNNELVPIGTVIKVFYSAENSKRFYLKGPEIINQHNKVYCSGAYIEYELTMLGWVANKAIYISPNFDTMAEFSSYIKNPSLNTGALEGQVLERLDLTQWDYFSGESFDGIVPKNASYMCKGTDYKDWVNANAVNVSYDIDGIPNGNATEIKTKTNFIAAQGNFDFSYIKVNSGTNGSNNYIDVGYPVSVIIDDSGVIRKLPRISNKLTLNVEVPECIVTIAGKEATYQVGDEITIHVNKYEYEIGKFTLRLGSERFSPDNGNTLESELFIEGPGLAVIYKSKNGYWKLRHSVEYAYTDLTP